MAAIHEDAASVLDQFVQDVANLPAEIVHLLEEIEAKDKSAHESRTIITSRDSSIQRFNKQNGFGQQNPKEEAYSKQVLSHFEKVQALQDEKVTLSEKARLLLDRQIKRLDVQIKALESAGVLPPDPLLPSLLNHSAANRVPPLSIPTTGTTTPLNPSAGNVQSQPADPINNAAVARRLTQQAAQPSPRHNSPAATGTITPTGGVPPNAAAHLARSTREPSIETKRRRLTNQPATSSSLRQSSLGPSSTPKAGTPGASGRAGSAQPRSSSAKPNRSSLGPKVRGASSLNPASANRKGSRRKGYRKGLHGLKPSPSDGDDSALSEVGDSENERGSQSHRNGVGGDATHDTDMTGIEEDDEDGADGDDRKYCVCRHVSYGNMVACDNDDCEFEWFHWGCVGMTKEPTGTWYCEACKAKLGLK